MAWWPVHEFLAQVLAQANVGPLPWVGSPAWCGLAADDPRKLLALAVAGEHWALRTEVGQAAMAEASRAVSSAADWAAAARDHQRRAAAIRSGSYIPRSRERRPAS
ncbi:DUF2742 domain-containing protein [Mycobacterium sp. MBM]|nr:DUF2742 domain-containing protein [Mycobacterium sp. MBM]